MQTNKAQTLSVLCLAFMSSNVMYGAMAFLLASSRGATLPPSPTVTTLLSAVAGVALVASALLGMRLDVGEPLKAFQTRMLLAMAVAESAAILGLVWFFLGGTLVGMAPFLGLALAVQGVFVLPKALGWRGGA